MSIFVMFMRYTYVETYHEVENYTTGFDCHVQRSDNCTAASVHTIATTGQLRTQLDNKQICTKCELSRFSTSVTKDMHILLRKDSV